MPGKIFAGLLKQLSLTLLGGELDDCVNGVTPMLLDEVIVPC